MVETRVTVHGFRVQRFRVYVKSEPSIHEPRLAALVLRHGKRENACEQQVSPCTILRKDSIMTPPPASVRFLRNAKRSCIRVQSELYVALGQQYRILAMAD